MKRGLFSVLSAASLLLCAATMALWVRSYGHSGTAEAITAARWNRATKVSELLMIRSYVGRMEIDGYKLVERKEALPLMSPSGVAYRHKLPLQYDGPPLEPTASWLAFEGGYDSHNDVAVGEQSTHVHLMFPYWSAVAVFCFLPALRVRGYSLHRLRGLRGLCPACGYDLRATHDRCPECGRRIDRPRKPD